VSQSDFVSRGSQLVAAGQYQEAVKVCRLGLLGRPTTVEGRIVLGRALLALQRYDEVLAEMRVALELDPSAISAHVLRGEALIGKADPGGALPSFRQAQSLSPGDRAIGKLINDAELLLTSHAGRPSKGSMGYVDLNQNLSQHYPARDSELHTAPFERDSATVPRPAKPPQAWNEPVNPRRLHGSVEVDPELEGIELEDDDVAPAPAPAPGRAAIVARNVKGKDVEPPRKEVTVAISLDELVEMEPPTQERSRHGKSAVRRAVGLDAGPLELDVEQRNQRWPAPGHAANERTVDANPGVIPQLSPLAQRLAATPDLVVMGPNMERSSERLGPGPQFPIAKPIARTGHSGVPSSAPTSKTLAISPALSDVQQQSAAAIDGLFDVAPQRSRVDDSIVISPPTVQADQPSVPAQPKQARPTWMFAIWGLIAIAVIGGGVVAGLWIRESRLRKQVSQALEKADAAAKDDSWRGHLAARDVLAGVVKARDSAATRSQLLLQRAILAYEFGEDRSAVLTAVASATDQTPSTQVAKGFAALLAGDGETARSIGKAIATEKSLEAVGNYVQGRGELLIGDNNNASEHLRIAVERDPRPLYQVALAEAKIAVFAIGDAEKLATSTSLHGSAIPEATVIRAVADLLSSSRGGHPDLPAQLDSITITASKPMSDVSRVASPLVVANALAVVAETQAMRGELDRAQATFDRAASVGIDDYRFAYSAVRALLAMGRLDDARKAAERAIQSWPKFRMMAVALSTIDLQSGNAKAAYDRLASPVYAGHLQAAQIRGRAALMLGDFATAQSDLDAVLKIAPSLSDAIVARAYVEVLRGDGKAALARLGTVNKNASAETLTVYGAALRLTGQVEPAVDALQKALAGAATGSGSYRAIAQWELARCQRDAGNFVAAKISFGDAVKAAQPRAGLELAMMLIENREPTVGREQLEAMFSAGFRGTAPQLDDIDGELLIALLRVRTLSGDIAGAEKLLKIVTERSDIAPSIAARERARLLLRKGDKPGASQAIASAINDKAADVETFLIGANVIESDYEKQQSLASALKSAAMQRLAGTGELEVIMGKLEFAAAHSVPAEAAFAKARDLMQSQKSPAYRRAMAHVGLAAVAFDKGDDIHAASEAATATELDPLSIDAKIFAAAVADTPQLKLEISNVAVKLAPFNVDAWSLLGQAAAAVGDTAALTRAISTLTDIAPTSTALSDLKALTVKVPKPR
jgi:tetratricopeptide (TPR) repeat protein